MTFTEKQKIILANVSLFTATIIWGTTFAIIKDHVDAVHPVAQICYRFLFGSMVLGTVLAIRKEPFFKGLKYGAFLGITTSTVFLSQTISLKYTTATNSAFLTGLFTFFVPLFSYFVWKEVPKGRRLVAGILAILGLWTLTGGIESFNLGDWLNVLTAAATGLYILQIDHFIQKVENIFTLMFQVLITVCVISGLTIFIFDLSFTIKTVNGFWAVLYLGLFATALNTLLTFPAQKFATPMQAALIFALEPVFAMIFAIGIGQETAVFHKVLGGLMVFSATLISEVPFEKLKRKRISLSEISMKVSSTSK